MARGYVYILSSLNSELTKVGGTDHAPMKRIREINAREPYRSLGPWTLYDFRQVEDWRSVEYDMHYAFRSKLVQDPPNQRELFRIAPHRARTQLERLLKLRPGQVFRKPTLDRMFQDDEFVRFLLRLFSFTGLWNWLDLQGAWTFALFPSTCGGRYYTINVGRHEVAFAGLPESDSAAGYHSIVMDRLIHDFPKVQGWVKRHDGGLRNDAYASSLPRSVSVGFSGTFDDALEFLSLEGVRRALIAYWFESLTLLGERGAGSLHARHHNWNAVAELRKRAL